jgi:hypothetical protein
MKWQSMVRYAFLVFVLLVTVLTNAACTSTALVQEQAKVNSQQEIAQNKVPQPVMEIYLERYLMSSLYTARDQAVATWSYIQSPYTGKILWRCTSVGFPIPGGTQLTNPSQYYSSTTLPQAEPNGLYTPNTSAGTYVMCVNKDGTITPAYKEPQVETSLCPIEEIDGEVVCIEGATPSLKIDPAKNPALNP